MQALLGAWRRAGAIKVRGRVAIPPVVTAPHERPKSELPYVGLPTRT
jgi:hypothetical protein